MGKTRAKAEPKSPPRAAAAPLRLEWRDASELTENPANWRRFGWYVWDQGSGLPGDWNGRFAPCHEFIWHFNRATVKPARTVPKAEGSIRDRTGDASMRLGADGTQVASSGKASLNTHKIPDSVVRVQRSNGQTGTGDYHPALFPVGLPTVFLECWPGDIYDPFLGSGTTLVAAHRLSRVCYGCELESKYADVILKRAEAEGLECVRE